MVTLQDTELKKLFTGKFVNIIDGKSTICVYMAKVSYGEGSVWLGYHGFIPCGAGLELGKLSVVELVHSYDGTVTVPFQFEVLDEESQETFGILYL